MGWGTRWPTQVLDVGCCFHVLIIGKDVGVFDKNVDHGGVFEVLTKAANSNAVAAMTCDLRSCQLCGSSIKGGRVTIWTKILYDLGLTAIQLSPPW